MRVRIDVYNENDWESGGYPKRKERRSVREWAQGYQHLREGVSEQAEDPVVRSNVYISPAGCIGPECDAIKDERSQVPSKACIPSRCCASAGSIPGRHWYGCSKNNSIRASDIMHQVRNPETVIFRRYVAHCNAALAKERWARRWSFPMVLRSTATRLLACQSDAKSEVRIEGEHTIQHTIQTKSDFSGSIVEWKMIPK